MHRFTTATKNDARGVGHGEDIAVGPRTRCTSRPPEARERCIGHGIVAAKKLLRLAIKARCIWEQMLENALWAWRGHSSTKHIAKPQRLMHQGMRARIKWPWHRPPTCDGAEACNPCTPRYIFLSSHLQLHGASPRLRPAAASPRA